jgi:hypothetical protein
MNSMQSSEMSKAAETSSPLAGGGRAKAGALKQLVPINATEPRPCFDPDPSTTKAMQEKNVAVIDRDGAFVCWATREIGGDMVAMKRAKWIAEGKRPRLRLTSERTVSDFRGCLDNRERTFYRENYAGHELVILKRIAADGTFRKWDNDLSIEEMKRRDAMTAAERRADAVLQFSARKSPAVEMGAEFPEAA